jgi:RNA polymerase sigma factor (sigma-70 family)
MTVLQGRFLIQALKFETELRTYLRSAVRNATDAQDLLQETYARLWRAGDTDTMVVQSIRAFAFTIARRVAIDFTRARRLCDPPSIPIDSMTDSDELHSCGTIAQVEGIVAAQQEIELLARALSALPTRSRDVFTLRKIYGYSQEEIATLLGISQHTVERHVGIASRRCAEFLCSRPGGPQQYSLLERLSRWPSELRKAVRKAVRK